MNTESHIRTARKNLGLSQKAAAAMVNIDQGAWSRIERGEQEPRAAVAWRIADALGIDIGEVMAPFRRAALSE
jgi:transcriptional regulator with XRE-family HTH domain